MMKRCSLVLLVLIGLGLLSPGGVQAVSVSPGGIGDALTFQAILGSGVDSLLAIESFTNRTAVHRVRFRDGTTGATALEFELCLIPDETFTAGVFRDGSVTKIQSPALHLINGVPSMLTTTLTGNPTRAFLEVIGLRATTSPSSSTVICTDSSIGGDVANTALLGKVYYVSGASTPPLLYGADAVALKDFAATKISDGTVFQNDLVAQALIAQGSQIPPFQSTAFSTRYFVPPSFSAVTQVVLSFPTGPNSGGCPHCRVPSNFSTIPFTEAGTALSTINLPSDTSLVRVISLSSSDIANDSGILDIFETSLPFVPIPLVGFGINTTTTSASLFFNALFRLGID